MPGCPNGAEPDPAHVGEAIMIQIAAIGADAVELLAGWWPAMAATTTLAVMPVTRLCDMNLDDPGDLTVDMVWADLEAGLVPNINSPTNTLGWWIWNKATYSVFSRYCQCKDTGLNPPPPSVVVPPTTVQPYPPAHDDQPQLNRIEANLSIGADGQTLLYQGMQVVATHLSDLWSWQTPNYTQPGPPFTPFTLQGEGYQTLPYYGSGPERYVLLAGVKTRIVQFPAVYKARGTLNPRYYGIGSIYWDARWRGTDPQLTAKRESIHYRDQVLAAPRDWVPVGISWHLQPGAVVQLDYVIRQPQASGVPWQQPNDDAFQSFSGLGIPSHVSDPPLWPPPTSRSTAIERASPYRVQGPP